MMITNRFLLSTLCAFALLAAGCAARGVDVEHRGPIQGEATVEGDRERADSRRDRDNERTDYDRRSSRSGETSGTFSGSASGSASGDVSARPGY
jgi:hypothetical protein